MSGVGSYCFTTAFLSTPSARRATRLVGGLRIFRSISIHALREEGDLLSSLLSAHFGDFYPRPPRGGRLVRDGPMLFCRKFLSTPSARRATYRKHKEVQHGTISIHALREEGDLTARGSITPGINFYPRPPRGGRPGRSHRRP